MLWRKLIRDLGENKGSYLACTIIALLGLMVFTAFSILADNLTLSQETFYREQDFAHGFIELLSMPQTALSELAQIEGIDQVKGRVVKDVQLYTPEQEESSYLRLVSLDPEQPHRINDVKLLQGRKHRRGNLDLWLDNQFFAANDLRLEDTMDIIVDGQVREVQIAGVGMCPEFVYYLRTATDFLPNPELDGIAFLTPSDMEILFPPCQGQVNDVVFTLLEGADYEKVRRQLEVKLEQYGLVRIYPREDQTSHAMLTQELEGLQAAAKGFPLLFLTIAGVILYITLKRLVEQQRGQIGILKALGYSKGEITRHYLSYALLLGAGGGILGGLIGIAAAVPLTNILLDFFNVPPVYGKISALYFFQGLLLSLTVFLLAGYSGVRGALALEPAAAMRPPAPVAGKKFILEKSRLFTSLLTMPGKMALRNLSRQKARSAFIFLGVMVSCALTAVTWSFNGMIDKLIFYQYEEVETYDAKVTLAQPARGQPLLAELANCPQVRWVEPLAEVPVTISHQWREENVVVLGVAEESRLYNILTAPGKRIVPRGQGLILSERLAEKLAVSRGSAVKLESPFLPRRDETLLLPVEEIIPQYMGMNAYMELSSLQGLTGQGPFITAALMQLKNEEGLGTLKEKYRESELVAGIDSRTERTKKAAEIMASFGIVIHMYVLIGIIVSFAIIYSSSFIALSEQSHELASMRVLGLTSGEVFSVITFEQWFISFFALLAGIPLGRLFQWALGVAMTTDMYTVPGELSPGAPLMATLLTAFSIWLAQRFARRRVEKLSLVEVLKSRE